MNLRNTIELILESERYNKQRESIQITNEILKLFEKKIDKKIQENFSNHYMYLRALKEIQRDIINN